MWHLRQSWAPPQCGAGYPAVQSPLGEYCKDTPQLITPRKTRVEICFIQGHWAFFRRSHHILHLSHPGPLPEQKPRMVRYGGLTEEPFGCWFFPAFLSSLWERQGRGRQLLWCRPLRNPRVAWQRGTLPEPTGVCRPAQVLTQALTRHHRVGQVLLTGSLFCQGRETVLVDRGGRFL